MSMLFWIEKPIAIEEMRRKYTQLKSKDETKEISRFVLGPLIHKNYDDIKTIKIRL